jgi:hypothetical protein
MKGLKMRSFKTFIINSFLISLLALIKIFPQSSFGHAVDFDGNGDYANTFNNPYFPTINGTIEAWVKVRAMIPPDNTLDIGDAFIAKNEEQWNNGDFYVFFDYSTGLLKSRVQKPPSIEVDVISNNNFWQNLNNWFHYAFSWGSGGMKMYINGVLQTNQNNLTYSALNNDYNFYVGAHGYKLHSGQYVVTDFFDGQLDELRIWNYQKNSQQIIALKDAPLDSAYFVTVDSGLVGYWRFDVLEDLGINNDGPDDVRDFSVYQNHLDLAGDAHLVMPDPVIPIELISFISEVSSGKVKLSWATATELNNYGFEIERCSKERDWRAIAFVEGKGTTTEIQNYTYVDDLFGVNSERLYYRLKQVDFNGQFAYSSELEVNTPASSFNLFQNYPNPFNPTTVIKYAVAKLNHVSLIIYDSLGQQVQRLVDEVKNPGYYQAEFDGTNLPSGVYYYSLLSGEYSATKKMTLIK